MMMAGGGTCELGEGVELEGEGGGSHRGERDARLRSAYDLEFFLCLTLIVLARSAKTSPSQGEVFWRAGPASCLFILVHSAKNLSLPGRGFLANRSGDHPIECPSACFSPPALMEVGVGRMSFPRLVYL